MAAVGPTIPVHTIMGGYTYIFHIFRNLNLITINYLMKLYDEEKKNVKKKKRFSKHPEPLSLTRIVKNWQIYVFLRACIYQLYSRKIYSEIGQLYIDCYNIDLFMTTNCRKPKGKNIFFA